MRVGLVLGAGGHAGHAFHAGVLTALRDHTGWQPHDADHIVGTSAGSVVGAMLRADVPLTRIAAGLPASRPDVVSSSRPRPSLRPMRPDLVVRGLLPPWGVRPTTMGTGLLPAGRMPLSGLRGGVDRIHRDGWPDRPLWIVAVNIETGRRVVFGRDGAPSVSVGQAVAASCAIPAWFSPELVDGERYVDGGVHSPTNADLLARGRDDLDLLVVCSPMSVAGGQYRATAALNLRGTLRRLLRREIRPAWRAKVPVLTFQPTATVLAAMGLNGMNPSRFPDVYDTTREAAAARLTAGRVHDLVGDALTRLTSSSI